MYMNIDDGPRKWIYQIEQQNINIDHGSEKWIYQIKYQNIQVCKKKATYQTKSKYVVRTWQNN